MANQWALLIGINQYRALQPLMYAQADAVALRNFFVEELGIPIEHCLLLTDMSATIEPHAHAPSGQEIEARLASFCRDQVEPGDLLWVFFSGYGLSSAGQDYWLPLDADPVKLDETAIAATAIFDILRTAKTDQIVIALDINRSQGAVGHKNIGQQTLTLAKDLGIVTLMSCQPDQYAHETMAIRHGLFTKALLEGLRYHGCVTASQLAAYLSDRVPELSQHHWRPIQNPATVIPPAAKFMMVVPPDGIARLPVTESSEAELNKRLEAMGAADLSEAAATGELADYADIVASDVTATNQPSSTTFATTQPRPTAAIPQPNLVPTPTASSPSTPRPTSAGAIVHAPRTPQSEEDLTWSSLWKWGALAATFAFLVGVFVRYQPIWFARADRATNAIDQANESVAASDSVSTEDAEAISEALFPDDVGAVEVGESALQRAEAAIATGRYGEARAWLTQVPPDLQNETYANLLQQANSEVADAAVRNQQILSDARQIIQPASASLFNDAIEQAKQVPPDDPLYDQAQADIARWSRVILDLAEGRANSGDTQGALAAAQLVPEDQPAAYQLAQQRIAFWQGQLNNQQLIQQMQDSLQPGQASSFQDAITALQAQIKPNQPAYSLAQERINQWSQDILTIARARAAQGEFGGAIAAAELVPEGTDAYTQAQSEIQNWSEQP